MSEITIRPAAAADFDAVQNLLLESSLPTEGVADQFPDHYAVAEDAGKIVAVIGMERYGEHGLLRSAAVTQALRGAGLGARLTADRISWSAGHNIRDIYLLTTTAADFFERQGFTRVDRAEVPAEVQAAPEFASICPSSAVVMRRTSA